ncbi:MAG: DUF3616 domain-containing protein [Planctomycetes bacterium]|nr:DUF3616 domain-containing protein [Planctomycetota bacterium]
MAAVVPFSSADAAAPRRGWREDLRALTDMLRLCSPAVLLAPAAAFGLVLASRFSSWHSLAGKDFQEVLAPSILGLASLLALAAAVHYRLAFLKWQAALTTALFCRELHFAGTNNGIYAVLAVLMWYAARRREAFRPFLAHRGVVSLLFGSLAAYAVAKTFDRNYWSALAPELEPLRHPLEETIESTGHLLILALVFVSGRIAARLALPTASAGRPRVERARLRRGWLPAASLVVGVVLAAGLLPRSRPVASPAIRHPGALPWELSSLAAVDLDAKPQLFLAASDERRNLSLLTVDDWGRPTLLADLALRIPATDGRAYQLDDLEGLSESEDGTFFAAASHRQLDAGRDAERMRKSSGTERAVVSFRLRQSRHGVQIVDARTVCTNLLEKIRRLGVFETVNWDHPHTFVWRRLARSWQIDIEGLAVVEGRLLLGFKNPVEDGLATILAYDPATDALSLAARPDFGGQGILSLCYDRPRDRLLVLTNDPLKGAYGPSRLWIGTRSPPPGPPLARGGTGGSPSAAWQFPPAPALTLENGAETERKASGLALAGDRLVVCFDDPQQPVLRVLPLRSGE